MESRWRQNVPELGITGPFTFFGLRYPELCAELTESPHSYVGIHRGLVIPAWFLAFFNPVTGDLDLLQSFARTPSMGSFPFGFEVEPDH